MAAKKKQYVEDFIHFCFLGYAYDYPTIRERKKGDDAKNIKTVKLTEELKTKVIGEIKGLIKECDKIIKMYDAREKQFGYITNESKACNVCGFFRDFLVVHVEHLKGLK